VRLRPAAPQDAPEIARLMLAAGGGFYEFLLDGLPEAPGGPAAALGAMAAGRAGGYSWRHCRVAELDGRVAGLANAYPADWIGAPPDSLPEARRRHIAPLAALREPGSLFLAHLAVAPAARRRGLGGILLDDTIRRARAAGWRRIGLTVWAENGPALALYRRFGFVERARADLGPHPRLPVRESRLLLLTL
jgi:ribosomal protein S18 acetylase RimI-like enzyme